MKKSIKLAKGHLYKMNVELPRFPDWYKGVGKYEYIKSRGNRLHFYDNDRGFDIFITKDEFETSLVSEVK